MAILPQPSLFSWTDLEARSDLDRLGLVLDHRKRLTNPTYRSILSHESLRLSSILRGKA